MVISSPCLTDKKELASPEQTVSGKDFLNPLIVDSLLKTIWFINAPCFCNKALAIPGTEYADVEEENAGVEYDFDLTEQQVTPLKAQRVKVQSQEMFKAELSILSATKSLQRHPKKGIEDMRKAFDREDLDTLWSLVKEKFRSVEPTEDMERAL
ncbi:hypothetical protein Tco_1410127 [Tanacetum coccineum]